MQKSEFKVLEITTDTKVSSHESKTLQKTAIVAKLSNKKSCSHFKKMSKTHVNTLRQFDIKIDKCCADKKYWPLFLQIKGVQKLKLLKNFNTKAEQLLNS